METLETAGPQVPVGPQVSSLDCPTGENVHVLETHAAAGLEGTTGKVLIKRPDGTEFEETLVWTGYKGGDNNQVANWRGEATGYYNTDGTYIIISGKAGMNGETGGEDIWNLPFEARLENCTPTAVTFREFGISTKQVDARLEMAGIGLAAITAAVLVRGIGERIRKHK